MASRIIVVQFITVDGVVEDPDGSGGMPYGGWAFRFGPAAVAGDKFQLGNRLESGALLLGRGTWQLFAKLWPTRTDEFSARMNAARKWMVSRTVTDVSAWSNSRLLPGELLETARTLRDEHDVIVIGSTSVAQTLMRADLVDEYRLLIFPIMLGAGRRLFDGVGVAELELRSVEQNGAAALLRLQRPAG